jgi:hypothetical protein
MESVPTNSKKTEPLPPMTPEQLQAEAAFAKKSFLEFSDPTPETARKISEAIKLKRRSKATFALPNHRSESDR